MPSFEAVIFISATKFSSPEIPSKMTAASFRQHYAEVRQLNKTPACKNEREPPIFHAFSDTQMIGVPVTFKFFKNNVVMIFAIDAGFIGSCSCFCIKTRQMKIGDIHKVAAVGIFAPVPQRLITTKNFTPISITKPVK